MKRLTKRTIIAIGIALVTISSAILTSSVFASCPAGCIDSGSPCGAPGTLPYCLDNAWARCLPQCVKSCSCLGGTGWCTCEVCTGCGCTPPSCPVQYSTTDTGCGIGTTTSCTNVDSCGNACGGTTTRSCWNQPVYTGAPSTPSTTYIKVGTTEYTLSTSSGSPTKINFSAGGAVTTYTTTAPSNGGYWYKAYNAYSSGTEILSYDGTTKERSLTPSSTGRIEAKHWVNRCSSYSGDKYYSSTRTGYYCDSSCNGSCTPNTCPAGQTTTVTGPLCETTNRPTCTYPNSCGDACSVTSSSAYCYYEETNTTGPSAPTSVQMKVGDTTYTLSTQEDAPTQIRLPRGDSVQLITPTISGADGYRYVVDNYGVSDIWLGGTECSGVDGEDFCVQQTSNTTNFTPTSKTADQVLQETAEGKITVYGYTSNDCDTDVKFSPSLIGYYEVTVLPTSSYFQIQVNTAFDFSGTTVWDSGKSPMAGTKDGERSPNITYAGSALTPGMTYYWRIKFWDETDLESPWAEVAQFTMSGPPTPPIDLRINNHINPAILPSPILQFTAVHSGDPNLDNVVYYEIEVNSSSTFTGTVMWDSGKQPIDSLAINARTPDITYAGLPMTNSGNSYYWRIRFWDTDDLVSEWSQTATFTDNLGSLQLEGLKLEGIKIN